MVLSNTLGEFLDLLEAREHMIAAALDAYKNADYSDIEAILILLDQDKQYQKMIEDVRSFAEVNEVT